MVALAALAPLLATELPLATDVAMLNATAVVIDGGVPVTTKIPLALDIRDELDRVPPGEIPDFTAVFAEHVAANDATVRRLRDDLPASIERAMIRGFRGAFLLCAALAALAVVAASAFRRRLVPRAACRPRSWRSPR